MGSSAMKKDFYDVKISIVFSLLAWPVSYLVDTGIKKVDEDKQTFVLMSIGFLVLAAIIFVVRNLSKQNNWIRYIFIVFAFTSVISLIISLEFKGWIRGFMSQYLGIGEPYLNSPWGCAISFFDGIFTYIMYLMLIYRISNGLSWRSLGIYWASALFNSMIVVLFGAASGNHNPTFCVFLNIPYVLVPLFIGIKLFTEEKSQGWSPERFKSNGFFYDLFVAVGLLFSIWLVIAKGMLSVGSQLNIFQGVLSHERALLDVEPSPFAIIQSIIFLFYALPILIISFVYIFRKWKPQFVWDLSLINGGMLLQAQFSFIVTALDSKTTVELRSDPMDWKFWINNLTLLIVPQLYLFSLYKSNVENNVCSKDRKKSK